MVIIDYKPEFKRIVSKIKDKEVKLRIKKSIEKIIKNPKNEGSLRRKRENVRMLGNPFICPSGGEPVRKLLNETIHHFNKYYVKDKFTSIINFYSAFIAIHPFIDGNGRTSRMILNWLLIQEELPPINFNSNDHENHCNLLNNFSSGKDKQGLADYIYDQIIKSIQELQIQ